MSEGWQKQTSLHILGSSAPSIRKVNKIIHQAPHEVKWSMSVASDVPTLLV